MLNKVDFFVYVNIFFLSFIMTNEVITIRKNKKTY